MKVLRVKNCRLLNETSVLLYPSVAHPRYRQCSKRANQHGAAAFLNAPEEFRCHPCGEKEQAPHRGSTCRCSASKFDLTAQLKVNLHPRIDMYRNSQLISIS